MTFCCGRIVQRRVAGVGRPIVAAAGFQPALSGNLGANPWKRRTSGTEVSAAKDVPARDRPMLVSILVGVDSSCQLTLASTLSYNQIRSPTSCRSTNTSAIPAGTSLRNSCAGPTKPPDSRVHPAATGISARSIRLSPRMRAARPPDRKSPCVPAAGCARTPASAAGTDSSRRGRLLRGPR